MGKHTFENAVVGDRVESVLRGEGTISYIYKQNLQCTPYQYPLIILFDSREKASYALDGKALETNINPELYWPGVQIIPPKRKKVKKTIKRWLNIYRDNDKQAGGMFVAMCGGKDDAEMRCDNNLIFIETTIVDITYESDDDI